MTNASRSIRQELISQKMGIFRNIAARTPHFATDKKVDKSGIYVILIEAVPIFVYYNNAMLLNEAVCEVRSWSSSVHNTKLAF